MAITLIQSDFEGVGQIATHCDLAKLNIAINEAVEFDLKPLLCNLFNQVDTNWSEENGINADIIKAKTYENCAGFDTTHQGLKKVLVYYAYSRYVVLNNFNDTPNGQVTKTNSFSIPKPLAELKQFSNKYRDMALNAFKLIEAYIFLNKDDYDGFDYSAMQACGCNGTCGKKTKAKGFGIRSRTIYK